MNVTGKKSISNFIYVMLQIVFVIGVALLIGLPIAGYFYYTNLVENVTIAEIISPILIYISGFPAVYIVYQFIELFGSLKKERPFIEQNGKALKKASFCSFIISICYLPLIIFAVISQEIALILLTSILFFIFIVAWIGLYILAELFIQAVAYKEENDLTI